MLIEGAIFTEDNLRKDLSIYLKRIISREEFEILKNWGVI